MSSEAQESCADAGIRLALEQWSYKKATPIIWPSTNLRGLVKVDDMKVPHSELAMHLGAAGKEILAFTLVGQNSALVVYKDDSKCGFAFGTENELLERPLLEKTSEMWKKRGPD